MTDRLEIGARHIGLFLVGLVLLAIAAAFGGGAPAAAMPCHAAAGAESSLASLPGLPETVTATRSGGDAVPAIGNHGTMSCCTVACGHSAVAATSPVLSRPAVRRVVLLPRLFWTPQQARIRLDRPPRASV